MSYNQTQNQNRTKLADPRFTLYGKFDDANKKSPKMKFMLSEKKDGTHVFKLSAYSAEGKGGSLEIPYLSLKEVLSTIGIVARKADKSQYRWEFNIFNPQTRKPDLKAMISVGKDDNGIVYLSLRHPLEFQQALRVDFRPAYRFPMVDREGNPRTDGEASAIVAANWAEIISGIVTEEFNRTWQFQDFQRKQNNNGGGYNNNRQSNGGGYNNGANDNFDDDFGF